MTESLEKQLEQQRSERQNIVQNYLENNHLNINEWENPDFGLHYKIDRYGFIHTEKLSSEFDERERKEKELESQRAQKWLKMVMNWKNFVDNRANREKLQRRVFKGIPDKLRRALWLKMLKVEKQMVDNEGVYSNMLKLGFKYSTEIRQIDNDILRCLRDHESYCERYSEKQKQLFKVLVAYSMYNMELGYCQGMSTVTAVLLIYLNEEEAFWALNSLMVDSKFAMHGLYIIGFPKLMRFLAHHDKILTKFLPKVKKFLDKHQMDAVLYSLKWFFVIFVERIPFSLCLRVWDIYFLEGERVLNAMAFTILKLHATKLLKFKDMDEITNYFQYKLHKSFGYTDNFVIKTLEASMQELRSKKLELPPPTTGDTEFPKSPLGTFIEPTIEKKLGLRTSCFTDAEKNVTDLIIAKSEENGNDIDILDNDIDNDGSNLNTVTNISDYEGDLSYMDDDIEDEITFTTSNQNRKSLTGTSITSEIISDDRRGSISTLNQQNLDDLEIIKDEEEFNFMELSLG